MDAIIVKSESDRDEVPQRQYVLETVRDDGLVKTQYRFM